MYKSYKTEVTSINVDIGGNDEPVEANRDKTIDVCSSSASFQDRMHVAISHLNFDDYSPAQIIHCLKDPSLRLISWLKGKLKQNMQAWKELFLLLDGVDALLDVIDTLGNKHITQLGDIQIALESVGCIKTLLNSKMGVTYFVRNGQRLKKLIKGILFCLNSYDKFILDFLIQINTRTTSTYVYSLLLEFFQVI